MNYTFRINRNELVKNIIIVFMIFSIFLILCTSNSYVNLEVRNKTEDRTQFGIPDDKIVSSAGRESRTIVCKHIFLFNMDSGESIIDKIYLGSLMGEYLVNGLIFLLILMNLYQFFQYMKAWLIEVSQKRFDIYFMHYIKLRDGKK